jgi:2-methylcitrate dehydratase PrpD
VQFLVAAAFHGGGGLGIYFDDFSEEKIRNASILQLANKVEHFADEECAAVFPSQFPAVLRANLRDGNVYEHRVMYNRGGPENPLTTDEVKLKFKLNASRSLAETKVEGVLTQLENLDQLEDLAAIMSMLSFRDKTK